ncbi:valine--tRNA ligase [Porphyromonas sp. COT-239 OH1446]|uniref:valine--tRNA ligase n=1 Tax=Porphyromonas sp. COT-239 OH1446 TaxID=1515613 RepID=UPI00052D615F|nr:valine--tRNA ligase [Porphyromonas sp. COT-239 OH1446]KGN71256.1 valyl-tRNA synthetase [Porphyromonas sp. COT-239 OH1446]
MELAAKYSPEAVESKWYEYWMRENLFHSTPDSRPAYTVVIPPPNVTGVLHMGHMLNNTIQDILVRRARMTGFNACWVPGTDHASIATEAKVVARLAEQGVKKSDLSREQFLEHAWEWTYEHGGIILEQLKRLGASCDWARTAFTMDAERSKSVLEVFVDLYNKGLIYRGVRVVNWDPEAKTALSDEEVIYKEQQGKLYYLRYYVEGEDRYVVVATTRPETIMGDTAVCINPHDERYRDLRGRRLIIPIVGRSIPVIEDEYVDLEFGTGCLKVTPAHDVNDHMLGEKHQLESIDIFHDDGSLNEHGGRYAGMDRFAVRKQIEVDLIEAGLMERVEDYTNKVGHSERTNAVIEPKLSMQWFLKMSELSKPALEAVLEDEIKLHPAKFKATYRHWMENVKDWCISRQLWWGHRIPAYYLPSGAVVVAATDEEALRLAQQQDPSLVMADLRQEEDALDTWFSSWLWPITVFAPALGEGNAELDYYYPTADLVTAPDILFFWVARMIIAGYEFRGKKPFENVYLTGIVRDKIGRKMSKSLGNSPDPLELIDRFGADGVRMGMMMSAPAGNDILFDEALCEQGRNFCNKVWNAFRLVKGWQVDEALAQPEAARLGSKWFEHRLWSAAVELEDLFSKYRLSEALTLLYKLIRDDFSSCYLELIKPAYGEPIDPKTLAEAEHFFELLLAYLHPFMPFITEELWQALRQRREGESLMITQLPHAGLADEALLVAMDEALQIISAVRNVRASKQLSPREELLLEANPHFSDRLDAVLLKLANLSEIKRCEIKSDGAVAFVVGVHEFALPMDGLINVEEEVAKLEADLEYQRKFLASVEKKLSNQSFVERAPEQVIALERKKKSDAESRILTLQQSLEQLRSL